MTDTDATIAARVPIAAHAGRKELKYIVPEAVASHVLYLAAGFLRPEIYLNGPRQCVTSLYLDSVRRACLRAHRQRLPDRFKLRIRRYGDANDGVAFVEVKRKRLSMVHKTRARVPIGAVPALVSSLRPPDSGKETTEIESLHEFFKRRLVLGAEPVVLVQCERESLRGVGAERETAVTVDRRIRYQPACGADLVGTRDRWMPLRVPSRGREPAVVMELKHGGAPPVWMRPLMAHLRPWRASFSKYHTALRAMEPWWP